MISDKFTETESEADSYNTGYNRGYREAFEGKNKRLKALMKDIRVWDTSDKFRRGLQKGWIAGCSKREQPNDESSLDD